MSSAKPTRAEHRDATFDAIKQTARRLVVAEGPDAVRLRAIARELGLTPPALYRYVKSHEELVALVVAEIYSDLTTSIQRAAATKPKIRPELRLGAAARAFRRWALAHPREFSLAFASPAPAAEPGQSTAAEPGTPATTESSRALITAFGSIFTALWERRPFPIPDESDLPAPVVRQLKHNTKDLLPSLPTGAAYVFLWCWARLYGAVCLEVFGHLSWALDDGEELYEQLLHELAQKIRAGFLD